LRTDTFNRVEGRGRVQQGLSTTQPGPAETRGREESNIGFDEQRKRYITVLIRAGTEEF
jgi:hypothetical protein